MTASLTPGSCVARKIVLHIADRDLADTLVRVIEDDPYLGKFPLSNCDQEAAFEPQWVYVIDAQALNCPRIKEMVNWKDPHIVLMVQAGDSSSYAQAWEMNIHKVVERSVPPNIMRLALVSEVRGAG